MLCFVQSHTYAVYRALMAHHYYTQQTDKYVLLCNYIMYYKSLMLVIVLSLDHYAMVYSISQDGILVCATVYGMFDRVVLIATLTHACTLTDHAVAYMYTVYDTQALVERDAILRRLYLAYLPQYVPLVDTVKVQNSRVHSISPTTDDRHRPSYTTSKTAAGNY
jgi:hypothetical protein